MCEETRKFNNDRNSVFQWITDLRKEEAWFNREKYVDREGNKLAGYENIQFPKIEDLIEETNTLLEFLSD